MRLLLHAHVIRIVTEGDLAHGGELCATEEPHRTVTGIGDVQGIRGWLVPDSLRLLKSGEGLGHLALFQVDDADRVVAEFRDIEPLAFNVHCEVINASVHAPQRNLRLHGQRRRARPQSDSAGQPCERGSYSSRNHWQRQRKIHSNGSVTSLCAAPFAKEKVMEDSEYATAETQHPQAQKVPHQLLGGLPPADRAL